MKKENKKSTHEKRIHKFLKSEKSLKSQEKNFLNEQTLGNNPDFVYGKHAVLSTLENSKKINKLFVQEGLSGREVTHILELAKEKTIHIQQVPKQKLNELTNYAVHQGLVLSVAAFEYANLEDLFELAEKKEEPPFFIILDGLEDPFNLGSILRTADATGVHGIILPKHRSAMLTSTVAKASTGAIEHVPVVRVTNIVQTIEKLKEKGLWIFGTDMKGTDYRSWKAEGPIALVIGNEGKGISRLVKESVDEMLTIPMKGHVQSLNAGVASAVLMYEVLRQREII